MSKHTSHDEIVRELKDELEKAMFTVRQLCGAHMGIEQESCPVCVAIDAKKESEDAFDSLEINQQRIDECIVAAGSLGLLPTELPAWIRSLRTQRDVLMEAMDILARLGGGRSHGNAIAKRAIENAIQ